MTQLKTIILGLLLALSACGDNHTLTSCRGASLVAANPGHWTPTQADLSLKTVAAQ